MKNYEQFLTAVTNGVLAFIPDNSNLDAKVQQVRKTNNIVLDGLVILKKNCPFQASPSIYLNSYFAQVNEGKPLEDVLAEIANIYLLNSGLEIIPDLNNMDNIYLAVINKNLNKELLKDTPHLDFNDLAIVFKFLVYQGENGIGSVLIKDHLLPDINIPELYNIALANTRRLFDVSVKNMNEVLFDMMHDEEGFPDEMINEMLGNGPSPMYIITNKERTNGASTILFNDALQELSKKLNSDLIIFPSSVHELIAIADTGKDLEELKDMVYDINENHVAPDEILSNNIYIYKRATNLVELY